MFGLASALLMGWRKRPRTLWIVALGGAGAAVGGWLMMYGRFAALMGFGLGFWASLLPGACAAVGGALGAKRQQAPEAALACAVGWELAFRAAYELSTRLHGMVRL